MKSILKRIEQNVLKGKKSNLIAFCVASITIIAYILCLFGKNEYSDFLLKNVDMISSSVATIVFTLITLIKK